MTSKKSTSQDPIATVFFSCISLKDLFDQSKLNLTEIIPTKSFEISKLRYNFIMTK